MKDDLINLSKAATLIVRNSGHKIDRDCLRNKILNQTWPFESFKRGRDWHVKEKDAIKYSKTYTGTRRGAVTKMDIYILKTAINNLNSKKTSITDIAHKLNLSPQTLYRYINSNGTLKKLGQELLQNNLK